MDLPKNIYNKLWHKLNYKVQVNFAILNEKNGNIIKYGCSKPSGFNKYHTSIHAEIYAYNWYKKMHNLKNIIIIIFKFDINKKILPAYSCLCCTKFISKYNLEHLFYTIKDGKLVSCIVDNPQLSFGMFLKFNN